MQKHKGSHWGSALSATSWEGMPWRTRVKSQVTPKAPHWPDYSSSRWSNGYSTWGKRGQEGNLTQDTLGTQERTRRRKMRILKNESRRKGVSRAGPLVFLDTNTTLKTVCKSQGCYCSHSFRESSQFLGLDIWNCVSGVWVSNTCKRISRWPNLQVLRSPEFNWGQPVLTCLINTPGHDILGPKTSLSETLL